MVTFDTNALAVRVRTRRGSRTIREVATDIGTVSISTLSRVEHGKTPDMETFLALCEWLSVSPCLFFCTEAAEASELSATERIELALRADSVLRPDFVEAVMRLIGLFHS